MLRQNFLRVTNINSKTLNTGQLLFALGDQHRAYSRQPLAGILAAGAFVQKQHFGTGGPIKTVPVLWQGTCRAR